MYAAMRHAMPPSDDLSPLKLKPFSEAVSKLEELMTQKGRAFLLGAGCSKCAGLPLTAELTSKALASDALDATTKKILKAIEANFQGAKYANIEDYLSELVDLMAIADRRRIRGANKKDIDLGGVKYTAELFENAIEQIKRGIAATLDINPVSVETHVKFVKAIHRAIRPGKLAGSYCVEYLVLNYDTLIEDSLAFQKVPFADGLSGGVTGWWDCETFADKGLMARVLKLHGSINWLELEEDPLPRRIPKNMGGITLTGQRILIWPASTKYRETQRDPYAQLASQARTALRPPDGQQRVLAVCGYSFGDSHINDELDSALYESAGRLTVVVFSSEAGLTGILKKWNEDPAVSEQVLIYGKSGFWHGDTVEESTTDLPWWKFENITRLLGGER